MSKETIHILDTEAGQYWAKWPQLFNRLMLRYSAPDSFLVTLLFLWAATVGSVAHGDGELALSQIPVRPRYARKYLAALVLDGFFNKVQAGPDSEKGSWYSYNDEKSEQDWDDFFSSLARVCSLGGLDDKVSTETFAKLVAKGKPRQPRRQYIKLHDCEIDGDTPAPGVSKEVAEAVAEAYDSLAKRKVQEGGHPRKGGKRSKKGKAHA